MTDLTRKAGDPLGIVVPATVECPICHGNAQSCPPFTRKMCDTGGRIPNPAAWQTCQTCGGSGVVAGWEGEAVDCGPCNGQGVTPRTLMIPEAVRVVAVADADAECPTGWYATVGNKVLLWNGAECVQDITHLWPEKPCQECGPGLRDRNCPACNGKGTVRTLPKPGEWRIVGHRPCELMPVVDRFDGIGADTSCVVLVSGGVLLVEWVGKDRFTTDITSHFPDGLPTTDDLAGVCGEVVLADEAKRVEP